MSSIYSEYTNKFKNLLDPDRFPSMTKKWDPLMLCQRDRYLTPEELKANVLNSARINKLLDEMSDNDVKVREKLRQEVQEILNEIGLASSVTVIRIFGQIISTMMTRICDKVFINEKQLEKIKRESGANPVLFLPSHRSYGDFILMSFVCFAYNIEIPAIAAGMDFHGMIGVGAALRKTGAFFMRRKFSKEKLYWHVFKEYMHALITVFHRAVEFFVEGTRSRSYKALPPKIGLLSMTMEPLFMGEVSDITIVPISVSYEKPLEENLFVYELLGVPKPKESTLGLLKSFSIIDQKFGAMFFDFGEPISARNFFGDRLNRASHAVEPAGVQILSKPELGYVTELGHEIIRRQQNMCVLNTFNLVSYYFVYRNFINCTTTMDEMVAGVMELIDLFGDLGAGVAVDRNSVLDAIRQTLNIHTNVIRVSDETRLFEVTKQTLNFGKVDVKKLKGYNLSEIVMQVSIPSFTFQLYINPCLHWVIQPAIMIMAVKNLENKYGRSGFNESQINEVVSSIRQLFSQEFVFHPKAEVDDFAAGLKFLEESKIFNNNDTITLNHENRLVNIILSGIAPFICCYYHSSKSIVIDFHEKSFTEHDYLVKVQERIETSLMRQEEFCHPYCLSLDSISLSLVSYTNSGALTKEYKDSTSVYMPNIDKITSIYNELEQYCQLLPFNYVKLCHTSLNINSKL